MNEELLIKTIKFWLGKNNNHLNVKKFKEIVQLAEKYGYDLGGMNVVIEE